jgi:succinate dehydrogenase / fumarate reductase cytochrome b subunit
LSPHLQIYKPQITSVLSITHRLTGIVLSFGLIILVAWLTALASGPDAYGELLICAQSIIGQVILAGLTFAFFFHLCCGIRHLLWDAGYFLELKDVYKTGRIVIAATFVLTAIVWLKIYGVIL